MHILFCSLLIGSLIVYFVFKPKNGSTLISEYMHANLFRNVCYRHGHIKAMSVLHPKFPTVVEIPKSVNSCLCRNTKSDTHLCASRCLFTQRCIFTYATGVNIHFFDVNGFASIFTPKKCKFTPVVYKSTCECKHISVIHIHASVFIHHRCKFTLFWFKY